MMRDEELARGHEVRRRILARARLYTWAFLAAALVVAIGGSALIAWIMTGVGLPFLRTWLVIAIIVLLPSLVTLVWRAVRSGE